MQLKNVIDMPCGLRFMLDELQLQSGYARRFLLDSHMMTSSEQLRVSYEVLKQFSAFVNSIDKSRLNTLLFRLQGVKDINTTINNLSRKAVLDDIELFEIKHLAILAGEVKKIMQEYNLNQGSRCYNCKFQKIHKLFTFKFHIFVGCLAYVLIFISACLINGFLGFIFIIRCRYCTD